MLKESSIALAICVKSREGLFNTVSHLALEAGIIVDAIIDANAFVTGLSDTEQVGSTGFMDGFAIPHCKSSTVIEPTVFFIRLQEGVEWGLTRLQPKLSSVWQFLTPTMVSK